MNPRVGWFVGAFLAGCVIACGCGSKRTTTGGGAEVTSASSQAVQEMTGSGEGPWTYDAAPSPALAGTPDYRLTSFSFSENGTEMKPEAVGACREAVKRLAAKPEAKLAVLGFADGFNESANGEQLGLKRAGVARDFLASLGIKADRMQIASFGSRYATAKDFEKIKKGLERRVEIWVLK